MLCRVADSLFWMSRYLERAETTARFVNVHTQMLLESDGLGETGHQALWDSLIAGLGDTKAFEEAEMEGVPDAIRAPFFLSFSRENPSSVLSSLYACRENAGMVRDQISSEMWEAINDLYLEVRAADGVRILGGDSARFFQEVIEGYHLFRGLTDTTFPRRRGYEFLKAGAYLERADKTSRFLGTACSVAVIRRKTSGASVSSRRCGPAVRSSPTTAFL